MTRIVGGTHAGRRLRVPRGEVRPSTERVREAVFNMLSARDRLSGAVVLDLFAGSGALGIEALSRGAASAQFIDASRAACAAITENLDALGLSGRVVRRDLLAGAASLAGAAGGASPAGPADHAGPAGPADPPASPAGHHPLADLVFCDPPYVTAAPEVAAVLGGLRTTAMAAGASVVLERPSRDVWTWPDGFAPEWDRRYGDTHLYLARVVPAVARDGE